MSRGRDSVSHSRDGVSVRRSQSVAQDMTSGAREEETALRMKCSSARRRRLDEQDAMGVRVVRGRKREGTDEDVDERKQNRNGSRIRHLRGRHVERANGRHAEGNEFVAEERALHLTSWNSPHLLYDLLDLLVDHEKPEALEEVGTRSDRLRGQ